MNQDQVRKLIAKGNRSQGRYGKRHIKGEMNKTEESYSDILETRKLAGDIAEWFFEPCSWRYGKGARFSADFMIVHNDGSLEFVDCKGGGPENEAATCRGKACAEKYWFFTFSKVIKLSKKDGGGWRRQVY